MLLNILQYYYCSITSRKQNEFHAIHEKYILIASNIKEKWVNCATKILNLCGKKFTSFISIMRHTISQQTYVYRKFIWMLSYRSDWRKGKNKQNTKHLFVSSNRNNSTVSNRCHLRKDLLWMQADALILIHVHIIIPTYNNDNMLN